MGCSAAFFLFKTSTAAGVVMQWQIAPIQVTVHHLASDDYVRQEATFWLANLRPDVQVYVEHSNEVWNPLFPQGRYATEQALVHEQSS